MRYFVVRAKDGHSKGPYRGPQSGGYTLQFDTLRDAARVQRRQIKDYPQGGWKVWDTTAHAYVYPVKSKE